MRIFAILLLGTILAGCAITYSNIYKKRDNQQTFDIDKYQCTKEAKVYVVQILANSNLEEDDYIRTCMRAKGWRIVHNK